MLASAETSLLSSFMRDNRSTSRFSREASPVLLGALGVLSFSLTFTATSAAEASFSPIVVAFALSQGGARLRPADLLLLAGIAVAGVGYTEGGILAREYGGWRVISWALILALPVTVPVTTAAAIAGPPHHVTAAALAGLVYVSLVSMCLGFFAWYQG